MAKSMEFIEHLINALKRFGLNLVGACRDIAPIVLVIVVFQAAVLREPFPELLEILLGLVLVILGLALFVLGLEMGLFPIGEAMAEAFAHRGSLFLLLLFGFGLGFSTTVAEPALIAVTREASKVAAQGEFIDSAPEIISINSLVIAA